jgi:hypothetical protein
LGNSNKLKKLVWKGKSVERTLGPTGQAITSGFFGAKFRHLATKKKPIATSTKDFF